MYLRTFDRIITLVFILPVILMLPGCGEPNGPDSVEQASYRVLNSVNVRSLAKDLFFLGDTLFVAEHNDGLALYDIGNPSSISLIHRISEAEKCKHIHAVPEVNALFVSTSLQTHVYFLDSLRQHIDSILGDEGANLIYTSGKHGIVDNGGEQWETDYIQILKSDGINFVLTKVFADCTLFEPVELYFNKESDTIIEWEIPTLPSGITGLGDNDYVAISMNEVGVAFADLSNGFEWISDVDTPGKASEAVVSGNYLYVADDYFGVAIIDISIITTPRYVKNFKVDGFDHVNGVALHEDQLVLIDEYDGLVLLDIEDQESPKNVGTYELREPVEAQFNHSDGLLYVLSFEEGITVLELMY